MRQFLLSVALAAVLTGSGAALLGPFFPSARIDARAGADRTATLVKANAGRAAYINAKQLQGHADPGAEAVARLFEFLAKRSA